MCVMMDRPKCPGSHIKRGDGSLPLLWLDTLLVMKPVIIMGLEGSRRGGSGGGGGGGGGGKDLITQQVTSTLHIEDVNQLGTAVRIYCTE